MLCSDPEFGRGIGRRRPLPRGGLLSFVLLTTAAAPSLAAGEAAVGGEFARTGAVTVTVGPNGAVGQPSSVLSLSDQDVAKIKAGPHPAALLFQTSSDWAN